MIINLPPRSLKSNIVSVAFVAWLLGHNPALQTLCASYGQERSRARWGWQVLSLPAIAQEDENYAYETPFGPRVLKRLKGEALHPEWDYLETLLKVRQEIGEYNFIWYLSDPGFQERRHPWHRSV